MRTKIITVAALLIAFLTGGVVNQQLKTRADKATPPPESAVSSSAAEKTDPAESTLVTCGDGQVAVTRVIQNGGQPQARIDCLQVATERSTEPQIQRVVRRRVAGSPTSRIRRRRSWKREVLIIAGSAGAGAGIGAIAGGKKGATIGALSGGVAGLAYDLATRNR